MSMPVKSEGQSSARLGFRMLAHVAERGDLVVDPEQWVGIRESGLAIEGFALLPTPELSRHDVRYRAMLSDRRWSDWVQAGSFCGSRGLGEYLLGYEVEVSEPASLLFLSCSARFVDGSEIHAATNNLCVASSGSLLEAMQILVFKGSGLPIADRETCEHEWLTGTTHWVCRKCDQILRVLPDELVYE